MKKRILHLTLKRIYFDQIAHGIKKEEYREAKRYWEVRLLEPSPIYSDLNFIFKEFDEICFRNGYKKDSPFMRIKCKGIDIKMFKEVRHFVIKLGKILELKNYEFIV